jgi:hypothetical protein
VKGRWLVVVAVAGVVVAHALDFVVVYGGDLERHHQLAATGHGYWPVAALVGLLAGLLAFGWSVGRGGTHGLAKATPASSGRFVAADIARLSATQLGVFAAVEMVERLAAGISPGALIRSPEFAVGLGLQVVVATVAVAVLVAVEGMSERVVRAAVTARQPVRSRESERASFLDAVAPVGFVCAPRPRGPPPVSLA